MRAKQLENRYDSAMSLAMTNTGEKVRVNGTRGKGGPRRLLETLDFTENAEVVVVAELGGNRIINVKGTRVSVSKVMAAGIMAGC